MAKKPNQQRLEELEDIKAVMNLPAGFRFMRRLINITGPLQMKFNPDHAVHSFLDGQRNVGNRVLTDIIEACPEYVARLLMETTQINQKQEATNVHKTDGSDEETAN